MTESAVVLAAMRPGIDEYGLDLMRATGLSSGSVYTALVRLRRAGLVETRWADDRRAYLRTSSRSPSIGLRRVSWEWWLPAVMITVLTAYRSLVRPDSVRLPDLGVYLGAISGLRHGHSLYDFMSPGGAPFTYPPFAGLVLAPTTFAPVLLVHIAWTLLTTGVVVGLALVVSGVVAPGERRLPPALTALLLASAPVASDLRYGQVSVFVAAMITVDFLLMRRTPGFGVVTGLAAAIKLTPLLFIPMLWLAGRRRAAAIAAATFAVCGLFAWVVMPADSLRFWSTEVWHVNRLGHILSTGNQSFNGALLRAGIGNVMRSVLVLLASAVVATVALRRAASFARRDEWFGALVVTGAASVVISPVSWTHHQLWLVLAALLPVALSATAQRLWTAAIMAVVVIPITSLGPPVWSNARLILAAGIACLVPVQTDQCLRTPSSMDQR